MQLLERLRSLAVRVLAPGHWAAMRGVQPPDDDDGDVLVPARLKKGPPRLPRAIAVPEPDEPHAT